jgi:hypothetical protein
VLGGVEFRMDKRSVSAAYVATEDLAGYAGCIEVAARGLSSLKSSLPVAVFADDRLLEIGVEADSALGTAIAVPMIDH